MFNYTITRLPYIPAAIFLFAAGACFGGLMGLAVGILARDAVGILGGMFLGLVCGIVCASFGLVFTAVFNVLAPHIGGLPVKLEPANPSPDTDGAKNESA